MQALLKKVIYLISIISICVGLINGPYTQAVTASTPDVSDPRRTEQFESVKKTSEAGNAEAQNLLGEMYQQGYGVSPNIREAFKWYLASATQGNPEAQDRLGWMYSSGNGVAKDEAAAVGWYRKAAEQGHAAGQTHLGVMYHRGYGITQDYGMALEWFERAAVQDYPDGKNNLVWTLATCPDQNLRNGARAVSLLESRENMEDADAGQLDTLAAAYAEIGRFDRAVSVQHKAIAKLNPVSEEQRLKKFEAHLTSYQQNKAWRDE